MPLSTYRQRQLAAAFGWIAAVAAFVGAVSAVRASRVDVHNQSGVRVTDLRLLYDGGEIALGTLDPYQSAKLSVCPSEPSMATLLWKLDGAEHSESAGYLECGVFCLELDLRRGGGATAQSKSCNQ